MNQKKEEKAFLYWLYCIEGVGSKKINDLLNICKEAKKVYELEDSFIDQLGFLTQNNKTALKEAKKNMDIWERYEKLNDKGIGFMTCRSKEFPVKLKEIPDSPYGIFCSGEMPDSNIPSVAVIGARQCTEYGRVVASQLGCMFAKEGIQVISGMARGIDSIAQNAAMEAGGRTFAVLGCGVDICYPPESEALFQKLKEKGGIISEYPPGTEPKASHFPRRNRIISGLSDAVVVVEARARSGTLITVDMALEQGREVYVVPGRVTDPLSVGCNHLIQQGAGIVGGYEELAEAVKKIHRIQWAKAENDAAKSHKQCEKSGAKNSSVENDVAKNGNIKYNNMNRQSLTVEQNNKKFTVLQREIIRILYLEGKNAQQIYTSLAENHRVDIATISIALFDMEKEGVIEQKAGYYFLRG